MHPVFALHLLEHSPIGFLRVCLLKNFSGTEIQLKELSLMLDLFFKLAGKYFCCFFSFFHS